MLRPRRRSLLRVRPFPNLRHLENIDALFRCLLDGGGKRQSLTGYDCRILVPFLPPVESILKFIGLLHMSGFDLFLQGFPSSSRWISRTAARLKKFNCNFVDFFSWTFIDFFLTFFNFFVWFFFNFFQFFLLFLFDFFNFFCLIFLTFFVCFFYFFFWVLFELSSIFCWSFFLIFFLNFFDFFELFWFFCELFTPPPRYTYSFHTGGCMNIFWTFFFIFLNFLPNAVS